MRRWKLLFALALALTVTLLLLPGEALLAAKVWVASWLPYARAIDESNVGDHSDKVVHFTLFAVLGWLAARIWWGSPRLWPVVGGLLALGVATEALQHLIPGRGASWGDFVADALGVGAGAWLWARGLRRRHARGGARAA